MNDALYTFSNRLPAQFPSQIVVDVTERCNLACVHCAHADFEKGPHYAGTYMSKEIHDKLIAESATDGQGYLKYLRYTAMGEPLLHPMIFDFIDKAAHEAGCAVTLTTNGTLLDAEAAQKLLDSGISIIDISLDAFTAKSYELVRRGGNRDKTYENVLNLIKLRDKYSSNTKIVTSFIEQPLNKDETEEFNNFWLLNGIDDVIIRRLHSQAGSNSQIASEIMELNRNKERRPCLYPWERLCLSARGTLGFCPANWDHSADCGDLAKSSIKEVWHGDFLNELRAQHVGNRICQLPCADCPDWAQTRWPHEGRSYADMVADFTGKN